MEVFPCQKNVFKLLLKIFSEQLVWMQLKDLPCAISRPHIKNFCFCGNMRCFMFLMLSLHSFKNMETRPMWWIEHEATDQGLTHLPFVLLGISLHWEWARSSRTWSHPPVNLCASDAVDTASFRWAGASAATSRDCQPGEELHCRWSPTWSELCWLGLQYFSIRLLCILGDFSSSPFSI